MTTSNPLLVALCLRELAACHDTARRGTEPLHRVLEFRAAELEASAPAPEPEEPQYKPCTAYPLPVPAEVLMAFSNSIEVRYGRYREIGGAQWSGGANLMVAGDTHWCFVELPRIDPLSPEWLENELKLIGEHLSRIEERNARGKGARP